MFSGYVESTPVAARRIIIYEGIGKLPSQNDRNLLLRKNQRLKKRLPKESVPPRNHRLCSDNSEVLHPSEIVHQFHTQTPRIPTIPSRDKGWIPLCRSLVPGSLTEGDEGRSQKYDVWLLDKNNMQPMPMSDDCRIDLDTVSSKIDSQARNHSPRIGYTSAKLLHKSVR
mgnify:CR=1